MEDDESRYGIINGAPMDDVAMLRAEISHLGQKFDEEVGALRDKLAEAQGEAEQARHIAAIAELNEKMAVQVALCRDARIAELERARTTERECDRLQECNVRLNAALDDAREALGKAEEVLKAATPILKEVFPWGSPGLSARHREKWEADNERLVFAPIRALLPKLGAVLATINAVLREPDAQPLEYAE